MRCWRALLALCVLGACEREESQPETQRSTTPTVPVLKLDAVEVGAAKGAGSPRLTAGPGGLALSWVEPDGEAQRLRARAWKGPVQTVVTGPLLQNWADLPSVLPGPHGWIAAWPQLREGGYDLRWARRDGARWQPQGPISDATQGPEFGFVSWAADEDVTAYWLDGRGSTTHHGGAMQLWSATIGPEGIEGRRLIDDRVCDCCQTDAAATPSGPVVVYRDRDENEVRDIWMAGPGPGQRRRLGEDGWRIDGCPVNGPAVAAAGDVLAVAWFSGATNPGHVRVAFAEGSAPFSEPIVVDDGDPLGRVDLVWLDDTSVGVTWIERTEDGAEIRLRRIATSGQRSRAAIVSGTDASRDAGFPQLERTSDALALAWVDVRGARPVVAAGEVSVARALETLGPTR